MRTNGDADGEALDVEIATQFRGSVLLPVGSRFIDERTRQNATLAELSACRWDISDPSASTVIFLSDMGELWHIDVRIEGGRLVGVSPRRRTPLSRAGAGASSIDSEGLEFAPGSDGSHVLVSTEEHARANTRASFLDVASYALADGEYRASPFEVPEVVRAQVRNNAGFEALAHTADGKYVATANERALKDDDPFVRRLLLLDAAAASGRAPAAPPHALVAMLPYTADGAVSTRLSDDVFGLVEFSEHPFSSDRLLSLERSHSDLTGNVVVLFEVDFAGATDVSCCARLRETRGLHASSARCRLERAGDIDADSWSRGYVNAVRKRAVVRWTRAGLRDVRSGDTHAVPVDNYEGMCLHPRAGPGGERLLLLVNDDNGNHAQIGTQFVLLALRPVAARGDTAGALGAANASDAAHAGWGGPVCHTVADPIEMDGVCGAGCAAMLLIVICALLALVASLARWLCQRGRKDGAARRARRRGAAQELSRVPDEPSDSETAVVVELQPAAVQVARGGVTVTA